MKERVVAAVLAGGEARRFGADKAMADLCGVPMIAHVARSLRGSAEMIAVVGHDAAAAALQVSPLHDPELPVRGPLCGVLAALEWARDLGAAWLVTAPCDAPLAPQDMAARLVDAARGAGSPAAFAATRSGVHALCAAWSVELTRPLRMRLEAGEHPAVRALAPGAPEVVFDDEGAFANINTPDEFELVRALIARATD